MKWQQHTSDDGFHCLEISADWSELADDYKDILAGYRTAQVPGFRPGKVPQSVIEKRFQKEIREQLTRQVALRLGREAVKEAGIEVLGQAEVDERRLNARLDVYDPALVDVADMRGAAGALYVEFLQFPSVHDRNPAFLAGDRVNQHFLCHFSHRYLGVLWLSAPQRD